MLPIGRVVVVVEELFCDPEPARARARKDILGVVGERLCRDSLREFRRDRGNRILMRERVSLTDGHTIYINIATSIRR